MSEFTNVFHTLRTNLSIKDSKKHLVLKYHGFLHKYIQDEMEFLEISSLGTMYQYAIKSRTLNRRSETLDLQIRSKGKASPNHRTKDKVKMGQPKTTRRSHKKRTTPRSQRRTQESGVSSIRDALTTQVSVGPRNRCWPS